MSPFNKNNTNPLPDFWISYLNSFKEKVSGNIAETRFIVLDTETTGFDFELDRILCIGAVVVKYNEISIADVFEVYVKQDRFNPDTVEIHGIIPDIKNETVTEEQAITSFLNYIGNAVLVAHHASFDITMINLALKRMGLPKLKNKVLDTVNLYGATRIKSNLIDRNKSHSLDEIAEIYDIDVSDRHTAAGDALITAIVFLKALAILNKSKLLTLKSLQKLK